jgi:hypothetical protein
MAPQVFEELAILPSEWRGSADHYMSHAVVLREAPMPTAMPASYEGD